MQPFSEQARSKDYTRKESFIDTLWKISDATEVGLKYDYDSRQFDDSIHEIDDYDKNGITFNTAYQIYPLTALSLEYSFYTYDNNDPIPTLPSTDLKSHTVFLGFEREITARLSGVTKLGYFHTIFKESTFENSDGFAMNSDLTYDLTDITQIKLGTNRTFVPSTRVNRESGVGFTSSDVNLSAIHHRWEPLTLKATLSYRKNDFDNDFNRSIPGFEGDRQDDLYSFDFNVNYSFKDWLLINIKYNYRKNDSTIEREDYKENRLTFLLSTSI